MANNRINLNHDAPINLTIRDHHAALARLNKHDRELTTLQSLLVNASRAVPWMVEIPKLRESGYTYGEIARHLDAVSAVLSSSEAAR